MAVMFNFLNTDLRSYFREVFEERKKGIWEVATEPHTIRYTIRTRKLESYFYFTVSLENGVSMLNRKQCQVYR